MNEKLKQAYHERMRREFSIGAELGEIEEYVAELEASRRWIPVSERLPGTDGKGTGRLWVAYRDSDEWVVTIGNFISPDNQWYRGFSSHCEFNDSWRIWEPVRYWKHIEFPEPPK